MKSDWTVDWAFRIYYCERLIFYPEWLTTETRSKEKSEQGFAYGTNGGALSYVGFIFFIVLAQTLIYQAITIDMTIKAIKRYPSTHDGSEKCDTFQCLKL